MCHWFDRLTQEIGDKLLFCTISFIEPTKKGFMTSLNGKYPDHLMHLGRLISTVSLPVLSTYSLGKGLSVVEQFMNNSWKTNTNSQTIKFMNCSWTRGNNSHHKNPVKLQSQQQWIVLPNFNLRKKWNSALVVICTLKVNPCHAE